jgi:hypothetical protein
MARRSRCRFALISASVLALGTALTAHASDVGAQRQAALQEILTTVSEQAVASGRQTCMFGQESDVVTEGRRNGKAFLPDASDICVALLVRTAHDGHLSDLYRTILINLGGDPALAPKLPFILGASVISGNGKMQIGKSKESYVPSSLAFDAGFTVAYTKGETHMPNMNADRLKALSELCLGVYLEAGMCFSAGYAEGELAYAAR